ncbi:hypothetical protein IQ07DRAFT_592873 [Pyrenochaeta sp. DS3sAY3a]|nr:hypothetical protein IQ07DRAFT_592873 [Pyrenochaeta sp. DS3sAY3a]
MSDYGDEYSDYGDDWFYVEDEYMAADDLAEHAVASPPPTTYGDEDMQPEWDRFDYFNDLEYASDGYDNATFEVHSVKDAKAGQKRKRTIKQSRSNKMRTAETADVQINTSRLEHSPIVWRAQSDRGVKPGLLDENAPSYAVLKNWREKLADTPEWAHGPSEESSDLPTSASSKGKAAAISDAVSPPSDMNDEELEDVQEDEGLGISQDALMAALQRQLAAAGGPLSGMDPQQLLQFAMRMATDKDAGDDIAGEMAEAMLEGDDEEDDADAEENLLSWVAQQRNTNKDASGDAPKSPEVTNNSKRPPTPPSSEANRSVHASETTTKAVQSSSKQASLKRKANEDVEEEDSKTVKKRATKSFDAPTAASQARAASAKATRTTRSKRS